MALTALMNCKCFECVGDNAELLVFSVSHNARELKGKLCCHKQHYGVSKRGYQDCRILS